MSESEALYGTKYATEKIRIDPPSLKTLLIFSLSLLTTTIQTPFLKLLLKLGRRASFFFFRSRCCVCVHSFSLEDARRVEERACVLCRNKREIEREKREKRKRGRKRFNWPEPPHSSERKKRIIT